MIRSQNCNLGDIGVEHQHLCLARVHVLTLRLCLCFSMALKRSIAWFPHSRTWCSPAARTARPQFSQRVSVDPCGRLDGLLRYLRALGLRVKTHSIQPFFFVRLLHSLFWDCLWIIDSVFVLRFGWYVFRARVLSRDAIRILQIVKKFEVT